MGKVRGFTLLEVMMALAIGLSLLSVFMVVWVALSKSSHQAIKSFEIDQDYVEAVSYVRQVLSRAVYRPHCPNNEWLKYQGSAQSEFVKRVISGLVSPVTVYDYPGHNLKMLLGSDFASHSNKLVATSNVVELFYMTPLLMRNESLIVNLEDIKGVRDGYVLATDCRRYVIGQYQRGNRNEVVLSQSLINDVRRYLSDQYVVQYYKINHELLYVIHESGHYQLIHNSLNGSNHMRLYGIKHLLVRFANQTDQQLLLLQIMEEPFYVRLHNL